MSYNLIITPVGQTFDLDVICAWLDTRPDTFEDPHRPNHYLMNGSPGAASYVYELTWEQERRFPLESHVYLYGDHVFLKQEYSDAADLRSSMAFLEWLVQRFDCRVRIDGYDTDLTEKIKLEGVPSLYPDDVRDAPLPWAGSLIGIGFYTEIFHGYSFDSLRRARRDVAGLDDEALATYLDAGHLYRRIDEHKSDRLSHDDIDIGPPHLLTDGVYVWPAILPYYIRTYHVKLPRHFVSHVRANAWQMPEHVDVAALPTDFRI